MTSNEQKRKLAFFSNTGKRAIELVEQGEKNKIIKKKSRVNWGEFWHLVSGWLISAVIIIIVLIMLTMAEKSKHLLRDVILRLDTLSLMFSLVLSAGLEQVWNNKKHWKYKLTQFIELALAFIGLVLYLAYSMMLTLQPDNPYLQKRFMIHLLYVIIGTVVALFGFYVRAIPDSEVI